MSRDLQTKLNQYAKTRKTRRKWLAVITSLSAVVAIGISYMLISPADSLQQETYCGIEEHKEHIDDCYEKVLVCQLSEEGHTHSESCYEENQVLTCALLETDGHEYGEDCYETERVLICNDANEEHIHTDECYEINYDHLLCELPIHEHTLQCFSNPDADVETASVWERTFDKVELTGNWNEDVLAIAKTQLGYTESTANYEVQEDGTTMNGYTRYGDWYGNSYGDWCAMFCSFCMNYAGVDRDLISFEAGCQTWVNKLSSEEYDLYHTAGTYIPVPGDLVFFDWDEFDANHPENRHADHVGFVAELVYDQESKELTEIKTIEGNSGNPVRENSYEID